MQITGNTVLPVRTLRMREPSEPVEVGADRYPTDRDRRYIRTARREGHADEASPLPGRENLRERKPRDATGMKQGRTGASGRKRQEGEEP